MPAGEQRPALWDAVSESRRWVAVRLFWFHLSRHRSGFGGKDEGSTFTGPGSSAAARSPGKGSLTATPVRPRGANRDTRSRCAKHQHPLPQSQLRADAVHKPLPCWLGGLNTICVGFPTSFGIFGSRESSGCAAK